MEKPLSLTREISPPRPLRRTKTSDALSPGNGLLPGSIPEPGPALAAVEAGRVKVNDHLGYFKHHLVRKSRSTPHEIPRLSIIDFAALYQDNRNPNGHHFVIHQHNHPKAGVHYDLRLQFSKSSSLSFAVPKGLPGNPNSRSIGRMAIETRVHNYWNHLIESASSKTGSLLIWDTGTYEILPRRKDGDSISSPQTTDDENEASDSGVSSEKPYVKEHENEKLAAGFQSRYIRLRLHGTKLPRNYTIILRLPSNEIIKRPTARRKRGQRSQRLARANDVIETDSEDDTGAKLDDEEYEDAQDLDTDTDEDIGTRLHNAYPGSTNDIGSIHQRHWFLMLDRANSGFVLDRTGTGNGQWLRDTKGGGFEPFFVRGRDFERSIVTGRLAREVESDEGVEGFVGRGGWVGIEH